MISKVLLITAAIPAAFLLYLIFSVKSSDSFIFGATTVYADHGQEIFLTLHNSSYGSLTSGGGNQVSVFANYQLSDNSIAGQRINAVMEVYAPNGTLIRTSSYPDGFIALDSGGIEGLETTIRDPIIQSVNANVTFRNLDKTTLLLNELRLNLNLAEEGTLLTTSGEGEESGDGSGSGMTEQGQDPGPPQEPNQEETQSGTANPSGGEDEGEGEGEGEGNGDQIAPSVPPLGNS
jgi:hypothetical protein